MMSFNKRNIVFPPTFIKTNISEKLSYQFTDNQ